MLIDPLDRKVDAAAEIACRQVGRLLAGEDGGGNIWSQEGERQEAADIFRMHVEVDGDIST